ncbi:hypothetical protein DTO207G8_4031 [Paecilomyces variotii]|nr:hypothetical protein DTO169E5_7735 [Paecilomyces variotii]KAJ9253607.1 hypothetical protein DTO207G8_4031 [Paecilomyces variotii]
MLELMLPLVSERLSLSALGLHTALLEPRYWRRSDVGGSNSLLRIYFAVAAIRISYTLSQRNHPRTIPYPLALTSTTTKCVSHTPPIRPQQAPPRKQTFSHESKPDGARTDSSHSTWPFYTPSPSLMDGMLSLVPSGLEPRSLQTSAKSPSAALP